jgi:hypothetical protein
LQSLVENDLLFDFALFQKQPQVQELTRPPQLPPRPVRVDEAQQAQVSICLLCCSSTDPLLSEQPPSRPRQPEAKVSKQHQVIFVFEFFFSALTLSLFLAAGGVQAASGDFFDFFFPSTHAFFFLSCRPCRARARRRRLWHKGKE